MVVRLAFMVDMLMLVRTMFARMFMIMGRANMLVGMLMLVGMRMTMNMAMGMAMSEVVMGMLMLVGMFVLVLMFVLVQVVAFHVSSLSFI